MEGEPEAVRCPNCERLEREVVELKQRVGKLEALLDAARRSGKRQAAPFRKPKKQADPQKPGRKPGDQYGEYHCRTAPEAIDETYQVPLPACCPHCESSQLEATATVGQFQTEIPQKPIVRRFDIAVGRCRDCGRRVQGRHELQTSDAVGSAANQLGPQAHAAIAWLNKCLGLSHGKVKELFARLWGLKIGRATSCRSMLRTAGKCSMAYEQVREQVRGSPEVTADETGWRLAGENGWLHVFAALQATCYAIDESRGHGPLAKLLGWDWSGVLVHDGWRVYDAFTSATHQQCLAHLLRRCDALLETATRGAVTFPRAIKKLLQQALAVRDRFRLGEITEHGLAIVRGKCEAALRRLARPIKSHANNERLARFLSEHADSIFTFLRIPSIAATNWRAEQAIRPAVVNRKVWGGNRTTTGAQAQATLMSVIQTLFQQHRNPLDWLLQARTSLTPLSIHGGR